MIVIVLSSNYLKGEFLRIYFRMISISGCKSIAFS